MKDVIKCTAIQENFSSSISFDANDLVEINQNKVKTTSIKVADAFGKRHSHVVEKMKSIDCSDQFLTSNFSAVKFNHKGNEYDAYEMTKDGFMFLVMGFTGKKAAQVKEAYINAFNLMSEKLQSHPSPKLPATLTPGQKCHIKAIIAEKCKTDSTAYQTEYTKLNNNFGAAKYDEILAANYPAACQFLGAKPLEGEIVNDQQVIPVIEEFKPIDVAEKMLAGLEPCRHKLPDDITHEIDRQAFAMALEAYELSREHIARQVGYKCVMGVNGLDKNAAIQVIKEQTLGKALAHKFHNEMGMAVKMAKSVAMLANQYCENITKTLLH